MATILVPTKQLHPAVRQLIKDLREGMGLRTLGELQEKARLGAGLYGAIPANLEEYYTKARRYSPREVRVEFQAGTHVTVNVAAFSLNAINGNEVSRAPAHTDMGSDGEPNYTEMVTYGGPVVAHYGYTSRDARVIVYLPLAVTDSTLSTLGLKYGTPEFTEAYEGLYDAEKFYAKCAEQKEWEIFTVAVDAVLAGGKVPFKKFEPLKKGA